MIRNLIDNKLDAISEQNRQSQLTDQQVLEELVVNNPDLERLESLVDQFNIFEAVGMVNQEIRHSFFLTFLLDPSGSHGLGDIFLKRLLQKVLTESRGASLPISLIDLDVWDLEDTTVQREWNSIDILISNKSNKLVVIIENKVFSDEHSDQLGRYWNNITQNYAGWKVLGLFLTPDGDLPSNENFLPVSYVVVADLIDSLITNRASVMGTEVKTLLAHYTQMLRRHIVSGSDIEQLCLSLYKRHQRALDLIFEHRPDRQKMIQADIENMIQYTNGFEVDKSTKTQISFVPRSWDVPALLKGTRWSSKQRIVMFYFDNRPGGVRLILQIGPGDQQTRQQLFQMASSNTPLFKPGNTFSSEWSRIYNRSVISKKALEEADIRDITNEIHNHWDSFQASDLPKIQEEMKKAGFL